LGFKGYNAYLCADERQAPREKKLQDPEF